MGAFGYRKSAGLAALAVIGLALPAAARAQDAAAGRQQFLTSCGTCHTAEQGGPNRQGPNLFGVVGRKAGSLEGFKYSDALARSGITWDEAALDRWIENAQALVPGSVMPYRQRDPDKRKAVIAYLKTLSAAK